MKDKRLPMSSAKYMAQQACYYQRLRYIFQRNMEYGPERRCTTSKILSMLQFNDEIVYEPLEVSQATTLEQNDFAISGKTVTSTKIPESDGTNACAYLTLGIIDELSLQQVNEVQELKSSVTSKIIDFPKLFNKYRTTNCMMDIYEAHELLSQNHLLKHNFEFIEILVDNEKVFSNEVQTKLSKELSSLAATAVENKIRQFAIVHADRYIFSVGAFPENKFIVFETHPIDVAVNGNGNGILVVSASCDEILQWIMRRLHHSNVKDSCTPFFIRVNCHR